MSGHSNWVLTQLDMLSKTVAPSAGVFAEDVFRGLDYVIAQAGRFGLKVVVMLSNYWDYHDSLGDVRFFAFTNPACYLLCFERTLICMMAGGLALLLHDRTQPVWHMTGATSSIIISLTL